MTEQTRVLGAFENLLSNQVDPLKIVRRLWRCKALGVSEKNEVVFMSRSDRKKAWKKLMIILEERCIVKELMNCLLECSYTDLFLQIVIQLKSIQNAPLNQLVHKTESLAESRRFSQDLFIDMKIKTHNICIGNPREYLSHQSKKYEVEFNLENDGYEKMVKADRYASSLCAEIDSHTMLYDQKIPTHGLFQKLKDLIPHTSNTSVTQVAYDSRMAIAYAIAKQDDIADDHIKNAMAAALNIENCVELVNMLYIYVFNLICAFEKMPTSQTLDKIIQIAQHSMNCLSEEKYDVIRMFWMRMFYLRKIFCLLGISNKCHIISGYTVPKKHVNNAKALIAEVDKLWEGIEERRQMFYQVAQARLAELEGTIDDLETAVDYIKEAIEIGVKGQFGETSSIKIYEKDLNDKLSRLAQQNCESIKDSGSLSKVAVENEEITMRKNVDIVTDINVFDDEAQIKKCECAGNISGMVKKDINPIQNDTDEQLQQHTADISVIGLNRPNDSSTNLDSDHFHLESLSLRTFHSLQIDSLLS